MGPIVAAAELIIAVEKLLYRRGVVRHISMGAAADTPPKTRSERRGCSLTAKSRDNP